MSASDSSPSVPRINGKVLATALLIAAILPYAGTASHEFVNWDDNLYVYENPLYEAEDGLYRIWFTLDAPNYYPVTYSALYFEHKLFGNEPGPYHLTSVLLHAVNAMLVVLLLSGLGLSWNAAFLGAILFAVHPVQVETVSWISEQKNLFSTGFAIGSVLAWIRWRKRGGTATMLSCVVLFCLSLLSKTMTVTLPLLLPLIDLFQGRKKFQPKVLAVVISMLLFSVAAGVLTLVEEASLGSNDSIVASMGIWDRILLACRSLITYLWLIIYPPGISPIHEVPANPGDMIGWLSLLGVALFSATLLFFPLRSKKIEPEVMGAVWFVISIIPLLGLVESSYMKYGVVADRYMYFPAIGLFMAIANGVDRLDVGLRSRTLKLSAVTVLVAAGLAMYTAARSSDWKNSETLWSKVLARYPGHVLAMNNLAEYYYTSGRIEDAERLIRAGMKSTPDDPELLNNLAALELKKGNYENALEAAGKAESIRHGMFEALLNMGLSYLGMKMPARAETMLKRAVAQNPGSARANNGLGLALAMQQRPKQALTYFRKAVSRAPRFSEAWRNLGFAYGILGRTDESESCFEKAASLQPKDEALWSAWAHARAMRGEIDAARQVLERGLKFLPESSRLKSQLAALEGA